MRARTQGRMDGGGKVSGLEVQRPQRHMGLQDFTEIHGGTHWKALAGRAITLNLHKGLRDDHKDLVGNLEEIDVRTPGNDAHWHPHKHLPAIPKPVLKKQSHGDTYTGVNLHRRNMLTQVGLGLALLVGAEQPTNIIPRPVVGVTRAVVEAIPYLDFTSNSVPADSDGKIPVIDAPAQATQDVQPIPSVVMKPEQSTDVTEGSQATETANGPTIMFVDGSTIACSGLRDTIVQPGNSIGHTIEAANPAIVIDNEAEARWAQSNKAFFFPNGYQGGPGAHNQTRVGCHTTE